MTGAAGFTGRYLVSHLESLGYDARFPSWEFIKSGVDIRNREVVSQFIDAFKPTKLIHLAGISRTQGSNKNELWDINDIGTRNVIDSFLARSPSPDHFVFASTAQVYSGSPKPINENSVTSPWGEYAKSKLAAEEWVLGLAGSLKVSIVRPFNYTGRGQSVDFLIPKLVQAFRVGDPSLPLGNPEVTRDFSDVRDLVTAYGNILAYRGTGEVFNVCAGRGVSVLEIIEALSEIFEKAIKVTIDPKLVRIDDPAYFVGDYSKLSSYFGWAPKYKLIETLGWMSNERLVSKPLMSKK